MCPNDLRSGPIYRFLSGSQLVQMTKIPFEILHFCEITNFGHNSNMPFLVLQAGGLLEGSVQLSAVAHLSYILFFWPLYSAYHFAHHDVLRIVLRTLYFRFRHVPRTASASIQSVVHLRTSIWRSFGSTSPKLCNSSYVRFLASCVPETKHKTTKYLFLEEEPSAPTKIPGRFEVITVFGSQEAARKAESAWVPNSTQVDLVNKGGSA